MGAEKMSPVRERRRRMAPAGAVSKAGRSGCAGAGTQGGIADEKAVTAARYNAGFAVLALVQVGVSMGLSPCWAP